MWFLHRSEKEYMFSNHEEYILSSKEQVKRIWSDAYVFLLVGYVLVGTFLSTNYLELVS